MKIEIKNRWNGNVIFEGEKPDQSRPAERFFVAIRKGDTPENNPICNVLVAWLDELVNLVEKK